MNGSIRFIVGLIICMGAVEANPDVSVLTILGIAAIGIALMASGAYAARRQLEVK